MIKYIINLQPNQHIYNVSLIFTAQSHQHKLYLPVWIPGSYMVREFSKNIVSIEALANNKLIKINQISKNEWLLEELVIGEKVQIQYNVYAYEYGIRTAFLDFTRGYFNPTSLCITLDGFEASEHTIELNQLPNAWSVATGLNKIGNSYIAKDYDELVDSPFELGNLQRHTFKVKNVEHHLILSGTILNFDVERILGDMFKICEYQINLFGGVAPYEHYTFILNLGGEIFTGLEHRNSTLLMAPYHALPTHNKSNEADYIKLIGLISHEFFHTWNVKRIKPKVFTPYNLKQENYTKLLWWFEGVTSYYDDLVMYRSGVIDQVKYLGFIIDNINNVYKFNAVNIQSIANSSLSAWVKYYRQDENSPNSVVSYYVKGSLVAMCLDLLIRQQSQYSLDDVLLHMFKAWQQNPVGIGEDEIPQIIQQATGVDLTEFIYLATETTSEIDLQKLLIQFGLDLQLVPASSHQAVGRYFDDEFDAEVTSNVQLNIGAKLEKQSIGYAVKNVYHDTSAENSGLAVNDIILAINNIKLTDINKQLAFYAINDEVQLSIFRQEKLINLSIKLAACTARLYDLYLNDSSKLNKWL